MLKNFDKINISQIQQANDIVDVISEHLRLDKKGKEFVGICPFHQDHRPSMYISPVKQIFKCFACGAGGDVFKFIQLRENLSFPEAVQRLADRSGIKLENKFRQGRPAKQSEVDPAMLARLNVWAKEYFRKNLLDENRGKSCRRYISDRQITEESVEKWQLGLAVDQWDDLVKNARNKKIPEKLLQASGLVVLRDDGSLYDKFRNRLVFPIIDVTGRIIGFGGRTLGDDPAKYMNSPATVLFDKSNCVYGLDQARHQIVETKTAVIVEGYTDVIMAHQFGCCNVVATLGTSFTQGHARLLRRYAEKIILVFDNDIAGAEAANRALEVCLTQKIDIKIAFITESKDPCDFLLESGADAFRAILEQAVDILEFKWSRLVEGIESSDTMTGRRPVIEEFIRAVAAGIDSGKIDLISRGLIVNKLSGIIGMTVDQINSELEKNAKRINRANSISVNNSRVINMKSEAGYFRKAQRDLLEGLINSPLLFDRVDGKIDPQQFDDPVLREIAEPLFEILRTGNGFSINELLLNVETTEAGNIITDLEEEGGSKNNLDEILEGSIAAFARYFANREHQKIQSLIYKEDNDDEVLKEMTRILKKKTNLKSSNPGMTA